MTDEMPKSESVVEKAYQEALDRMTGVERVQRTASLFGSMTRMLRHQLRLQNPQWSDRRLRFEAARILYMDDPQTQKLIAMALANEPDNS